jgi:putative ABC transport system substrate-binding protein
VDLTRRSASYVDRILRGAKPGDSRWSNVPSSIINLKTAKALGLSIPPAMLARADVQ